MVVLLVHILYLHLHGVGIGDNLCESSTQLFDFLDRKVNLFVCVSKYTMMWVLQKRILETSVKVEGSNIFIPCIYAAHQYLFLSLSLCVSIQTRFVLEVQTKHSQV